MLIALTDGNDTGSQVPPREAAEIARDRKVTIHTVAVGDPTAAGEDKLDEETVRAVAAATGGRYSHAGDREALARIYDDLDKLRTREAETVSHRPRLDLFYWPLGAALLFSLAYHLAWAIRAAARSTRTVPVATAAALPAAAAFGQFHFLRPWWLLALLPALALFWAIRRQQDLARPWRGVIADHLLPYLLSGEQGRRFRPELLLLAGWVVTTFAVAGPTWRHEPSPFAQDEAALVLALEVTPTMRAQDVQPSRLERAAQKIRDIVAQRRGTRSALVAYAGSAHLVIPLTRDGQLIASFASELSPEVMPREGNSLSEALALAGEQLRRSGLPGSILVLTDAVPPEELPRLAAWRKSSDAPVQLLAVAEGPDTPPPASGPPAPALDRAALEQAAHELDASLTVVSPDDGDVRWLARHVRTRMVAATGAEETGQRWKDAGYWLGWAVAALALMWFRPGWAVQWQ